MNTYQALEGIRNITVVLLNQNRTCPLDIISLFLNIVSQCFIKQCVGEGVGGFRGESNSP